jgi:hypothetical protein
MMEYDGRMDPKAWDQNPSIYIVNGCGLTLGQLVTLIWNPNIKGK